MPKFQNDRPTVDLGWATIYLYPDKIVVTVDIKTPAEVESHHSRNPNHKFMTDEATYIKIDKN